MNDGVCSNLTTSQDEDECRGGINAIRDNEDNEGFAAGHARADARPGGRGESWGVGLSVSEALLSSSSSSVCSALWYSISTCVLWVMVMVQGPCAHGSPSTCMGIVELFRTSCRGTGQSFSGVIVYTVYTLSYKM